MNSQASDQPTNLLWKIQLFGGPILHSANGARQSQFRSKKVESLLCYLAVHHEKPCSRDALIEALWPDEIDQKPLANRFRVTLASLRKQLEPPGFPFGSVLDTSVSSCIALRKGATSCDLIEFETEFANSNFQTAASIMQAPLLPGVYDEWAHEHQIRYELLKEELAPYRSARSGTPNKTAAIPQPRPANHSLPSFLTPYIPDDATLSQLTSLISSQRLITITGTAGIGKTRLSIEAARATQLNAVFVPVADCTTDHEFYEAIIKALGVGTRNSRSEREQLLNALQAVSSTLVIVDNIDHLVELASEFLSTVLAANPNLRCIVTSRQTLEVPGEAIFRLETLPYPTTDLVSISDLQNYAATALFLQRISQTRPDFRPQESHVPLIVEICARLQGLPLAIELAAAQISALSIPEILNQLSQNLLELKSRQRTLSPKHRSLRAALAGSFDGLDPEFLFTLGQLACFWGGFTNESAKAITNSPDIEHQVAELVHRSLINSQIESHPTRFVFLESVRQFAQEQLTPAQFQAVVQAHQHYFLSLAAQVDEVSLDALEPLDQDSSNLNAAFHSPDPTSTLYWQARIGAIFHSCFRGNYAAGLRHVRASQQHLEQIPSSFLKRDWIVATLQILPEVELFNEAEELAKELQTIAEDHSDPIAQFEYQINFGLVLSRQNNQRESILFHQKALSLANEIGEPKYIQSALGHLSGSLHSFARLLDSEDPERAPALSRARDFALQLIHILNPHSRRHPIAHLLFAVADFYAGDLAVSKPSFQTAYQSAVTLQHKTIQLYCMFFLSEIAAFENENELADRYWSEFLRLKQQTGMMLNGEIWNRKYTRN